MVEQQKNQEETKLSDKHIQSTDIDYTKFSKTITVVGVIIPLKQVQTFIKPLKQFLLHIHKIPNVCQIPNVNDSKYMLLSSEYQLTNKNEWPEELLKPILEKKFECVEHLITLTYDNLTMNEVLKEILPKNSVLPTSFEIVGTIAHFNLHTEIQLQYKHIIGKVLLDKNPLIKTVVNKTEALSNEYRTPELEVIAGNPNLETEVHEGHIKFLLDYSKVYWNSRLSYERDRLLSKFKSTDILCDLFCGVGPLALRAARKGLLVMANDLNPECYKYLQLNVTKNKLSSRVKCSNMCARAFFQKIIKKDSSLDGDFPKKFRHFNYVYMNLPGLAIEFLDIFQGFLHKADPDIWTENNLPIVIVYTFLEEEIDPEKLKLKLTNKIKMIMGKNFMESDIIDIVDVRDISTNKKMYSIELQISKEVALDSQIDTHQYEKLEKKTKLNE